MDTLHARLLPGYFRRPPDDTPARLRSEVERILLAADERLRVAARGGEVIGLCHAQVYDTPPQPALTPCRRTHIDSLVVAPHAQRRGLGRRLVDDAAVWGGSRCAIEVVLTVWAGNDTAQRFYAALGFRAVNTVLARTVG